MLSVKGHSKVYILSACVFRRNCTVNTTILHLTWFGNYNALTCLLEVLDKANIKASSNSVNSNKPHSHRTVFVMNVTEFHFYHTVLRGTHQLWSFCEHAARFATRCLICHQLVSENAGERFSRNSTTLDKWDISVCMKLNTSCPSCSCYAHQSADAAVAQMTTWQPSAGRSSNSPAPDRVCHDESHSSSLPFHT